MPPTLSLAEIRAYLGDTSAPDEALASAYAAEAAAQSRRCRPIIGDSWTGYEDLREALLRRITRNLAARSVPLATWNPEAGFTVRVSGSDAEVDRLEAPFRRVVLG